MFRSTANSVDESFFKHGAETSEVSHLISPDEVQSWFDVDDYSEDICAYWIHKPFTFAVIYPDLRSESELNEKTYTLYEADGTGTDKLLNERISDTERNELESGDTIADCLASIEDTVDISAISNNTLAKMSYILLKQDSLFAELYPIVMDSNVKDLFITERDDPIIKTYSSGSTKYDKRYTSEELDRLLEQMRTKLTDQNKVSSDGYIEGKYTQFTQSSSSKTLHISCEDTELLTIPMLVESNMIDEQIGAYLWLLIDSNASFEISGSAQSGRTTLMRALLDFIPEDNRSVLIGEELYSHKDNPYTQHFVREENSDNLELFELGSSMLTSNFVVDGNLTSEQIQEVFDIMSNGRTVWYQNNADTLNGSVNRLERYVTQNKITNLNVQIQLRTLIYRDKPILRVVGISELGGVTDESAISVSKIFERDPKTDDWLCHTNDSDELYRAGQQLVVNVKQELENREEIISAAVSNGIYDRTEFRKYVTMYTNGASTQKVIHKIKNR